MNGLAYYQKEAKGEDGNRLLLEENGEKRGESEKRTSRAFVVIHIGEDDMKKAGRREESDGFTIRKCTRLAEGRWQRT